MSFFLALITGVWALSAQFLYNRLLFFYLTNSDYATAAAISLHLTGFFIGCWIARRIENLQAGALAALLSAAITVAGKTMVWDLGTDLMPVPLLIKTIIMMSCATAGTAGFITLCLVRHAENTKGISGVNSIILADGVGSIIGAMLTGFVLLPHLGVTTLFFCVMAMQLATHVLWLTPDVAHVRLLAGFFLCLPFIATGHTSAVNETPIFQRAQGYPLPYKRDTTKIITTTQSPYGIITVADVVRPDEAVPQERMLLLDSRVLCHTTPSSPNAILGTSEYQIGDKTVRAALPRWNGGRVAVLGLGCGFTLQAVLSALPPNARVDVVELNPEMPKISRQFAQWVPKGIEDKRVTLIIEEAFHYFANRSKNAPKYDAVVIDIAMGESINNVAHLFSKEMYENIAAHLASNGVLGVWTLEPSPFSKVSRSVHRTIKNVFPVVISAPQLYLAARENLPYLHRQFDEQDLAISSFADEAAQDSPINTLDTLVINQMPYAHSGL